MQTEASLVNVNLCGVDLNTDLEFFMIRDDLMVIELYVKVESDSDLKGRQAYLNLRAETPNSTIKVHSKSNKSLLLTSDHISSINYQIMLHDRYGLIENCRIELSKEIATTEK